MPGWSESRAERQPCQGAWRWVPPGVGSEGELAAGPLVGGDAVTPWLGSPHWVGGECSAACGQKMAAPHCLRPAAEGGGSGACPLSSKALGGAHSFIWASKKV